MAILPFSEILKDLRKHLNKIEIEPVILGKTLQNKHNSCCINCIEIRKEMSYSYYFDHHKGNI